MSRAAAVEGQQWISAQEAIEVLPSITQADRKTAAYCLHAAPHRVPSSGSHHYCLVDVSHTASTLLLWIFQHV